MKNLLLLSLLVTLNLSFSTAQTGAIYNFTFRIDDELITKKKVQNKDHKILNLSTIESMPKELSDTILIVTEKMLGEHLNANLFSIRPEEKAVMSALPEHLKYLPANRYKKTVSLHDTVELFININCYISASGGTKVSLGKKSFSNVKPKLTLSFKVLDDQKNVLETKKTVLKDFEKLRSKTFEKTYGIKGLAMNTDEVTESETINSNDVLRMYVMGLTSILE